MQEKERTRIRAGQFYGFANFRSREAQLRIQPHQQSAGTGSARWSECTSGIFSVMAYCRLRYETDIRESAPVLPQTRDHWLMAVETKRVQSDRIVVE
jgi:hypothetical protein